MSAEKSTPKSGGGAWQWLAGKFVYSLGFGIAVLLLVGAALFYFNRAGAERVQVIRIGYGEGGPVRKYFLEQMAIHGKSRNLDIRLVPTEGADQTMSLIDRNGADMGLIPAAVEDRAERKALEISPLYMEPLQLLVKAELYESVLKDFGQLRGKSIDLDSPSSSTYLLGIELLRFIGLTDPVTGKPQYRPVYIPQAQLMDLKVDTKDAASLPDAIFQIGGIPSLTLRKMIVDNNYRLVPLPFGGSFNLDKFRESEAPDPADGTGLRLNKTFIEESVIPAFVYSVLPSVPPGDTRTIATRLLLVGSDRLDDNVVRRVLDLLFSPEISGLVRPALTTDILNSDFEFERHHGSASYVDSLKPFHIDDALQAYGKMCEIWGIIAAFYFAAVKAVKFLRERKSRVPGIAVGDLLSEILEVEAAANASCTEDERIALDQRLSEIKKRAIELHLEGRLENTEDFPSLLVTLADTRVRIWS